MALFYLGFIAILLCFPQYTVNYAYEGLTQWATGMVPTLFPFMIISSMMIMTGIDTWLVKWGKLFLKPWFSCNENGLYAVFMGFLCGFPMGAKASCDLLKAKKITKQEAEYLLAFCNNIGPTYFLGIAYPLVAKCGYTKKIPLLFGLYGIPFLYGILLSKVIYKKSTNRLPQQKENQTNTSMTAALRMSCLNAIQSILLLGGYVTFVNAFRALPDILKLSPYISSILGGFLEIVNGIPGIFHNELFSSAQKAFWIMVSLSFSGICCMLQTSSIIMDEELSFSKYILHKIIITAIASLYYAVILF